LSDYYVVGTLDLCQEKPDPMQKESGPTCWEKTSKTCLNFGIFWRLPKSAKLDHILEVFSRQGDRIELIPFALLKASSDTSLEYPQRIILRTLKFHFFRVDPPLWDP
jgi:hypothetical protein